MPIIMVDYAENHAHDVCWMYHPSSGKILEMRGFYTSSSRNMSRDKVRLSLETLVDPELSL